MNTPNNSVRIPIKLETSTIYAEVTVLNEREPAAAGVPDIEPLFAQVGELAKQLREHLKKVTPAKTTIEFGVSIGIESGKLAALIAKGSAEANLTVKLEWE